MGETEKYARPLQRAEGWLCLDFANTAEWHTSDQPTEELQSYGDLVGWAQRKGILTAEEAKLLAKEAELQRDGAAAALGRAIDLRETVYRIFAAIATGGSLAPADLAALNAALAAGSTHFQVVSGQEGFAWDWQAGPGGLDSVLWPVARSAANLLTSEDLSRVGQCADDRGCGWLFLDTSRNRSRRWCSMDGCGNRAKARLHYKRQHGEA